MKTLGKWRLFSSRKLLSKVKMQGIIVVYQWIIIENIKHLLKVPMKCQFWQYSKTLIPFKTHILKHKCIHVLRLHFRASCYVSLASKKIRLIVLPASVSEEEWFQGSSISVDKPIGGDWSNLKGITTCSILTW